MSAETRLRRLVTVALNVWVERAFLAAKHRLRGSNSPTFDGSLVSAEEIAATLYAAYTEYSDYVLLYASATANFAAKAARAIDAGHEEEAAEHLAKCAEYLAVEFGTLRYESAARRAYVNASADSKRTFLSAEGHPCSVAGILADDVGKAAFAAEDDRVTAECWSEAAAALA